jgi:hypothetical protein
MEEECAQHSLYGHVLLQERDIRTPYFVVCVEDPGPRADATSHRLIMAVPSRCQITLALWHSGSWAFRNGQLVEKKSTADVPLVWPGLRDNLGPPARTATVPTKVSNVAGPAASPAAGASAWKQTRGFGRCVWRLASSGTT